MHEAMPSKTYIVSAPTSTPSSGATNGEKRKSKSSWEFDAKHDPDTLSYHGDEEDATLTSCGMGSWRPAWAQSFATPIIFLINMSIVGTIQGMTGPLFFSTISTLEKRYAFDSKVSAAILIADNFSQMLISPFVGYLSVRFNRSRLIGIGELILAASCFITASPYFIFGHAEHLLNDYRLSSSSLLSSFANRTTSNSFEFCSSNSTTSHAANSGACTVEQANAQTTTVWLAVIILFAGSFFRGIGFTCYFVIGLPYLDDNVSKKKSPIFMSVMQAMRLLGPASGFMLSSVCLRYYENPFLKPDFGRGDPRFVGAWWLGFCIAGALLTIAAFPMLFFPFQFRNASVRADKMRNELTDNGGSREAFRRFIKNPVVVLYMIGNIFRYIAIGGYVMFKTKYIESQFRQSSSAASFITGTTSVMPMGIGILLGGAMLSVFKPRPRIILIYVFLAETASIFGIGSGIFLGCDPINLHGTSAATNLDNGALTSFTLNSTCNQDCDCTTRVYTPLCGPDSVTTYFSPCYAGCKSYNALNSTFDQCSCFDGEASKGFCPSNASGCVSNMYTYLLSVLCGAIIAATCRTANSLISFRTVAPVDKGFTMGVASSMMAIFAFIPYPIIFGSIVDSTCLVWESKCGKTGNCWVYDQVKFRRYLHGGSVAFLIIGSCFDFVMIFFSDRVKNFYDDDDEEGEDAKISKNEIAKSGKVLEKSNSAKSPIPENRQASEMTQLDANLNALYQRSRIMNDKSSDNNHVA